MIHSQHDTVIKKLTEKFQQNLNSGRKLAYPSQSFVDSQEISQERAQYGLYCYYVQLSSLLRVNTVAHLHSCEKAALCVIYTSSSKSVNFGEYFPEEPNPFHVPFHIFGILAGNFDTNR
eukprot:g33692.t1